MTQVADLVDAALKYFALADSSPDDAARDIRRLVIDRSLREGVRSVADEQAHLSAYRLRLALDLSPRTAVHYDVSNPTPRWELVSEYLSANHGIANPLLERLARSVASTLSAWESSREMVADRRLALLKRDGPRCRACKLDLLDRPVERVQARPPDPFKPYHLDAEALTATEVDHIEPISSLGTNQVANLQLLCRWCNAGKSDGLGMDFRKEASLAGTCPEDAPRSHMAALFYTVVARDAFVCRLCEGNDNELTMRFKRPLGTLTRGNLITACYECAGTV